MAEDEQSADDAPAEEQAEVPGTEPTIKNVQFPEIAVDADGPGKNKIDMILDIAVPVSVQLGQTRMMIEDVLALGPGSVVELEKLAGELLDVLVHDKIVAQGEVVVVDENFGVRITDILDPEQRVRSLR